MFSMLGYFLLSANAELVDLFSYFNFDLETAQSVLQLWPPMYSVEGVLCTDGKKAYQQEVPYIHQHQSDKNYYTL